MTDTNEEEVKTDAGTDTSADTAADDTSTAADSTDNSDDADTGTGDEEATDDSADTSTDADAEDFVVAPKKSVASEQGHVDPVQAAKNAEAARTAPATDTAFDPDQAETGVTFHLNTLDTKTRSFDEDQHGTSWKDIAAEFFGTNKHKVKDIEYHS